MSTSPYRPNAYYYRKIAREGSKQEMREVIHDLLLERERLRSWVREHGMIPPLFKVPEQKAAEIIDSPASAWQEKVSRRLKHPQ